MGGLQLRRVQARAGQGACGCGLRELGAEDRIGWRIHLASARDARCPQDHRPTTQYGGAATRCRHCRIHISATSYPVSLRPTHVTRALFHSRKSLPLSPAPNSPRTQPPNHSSHLLSPRACPPPSHPPAPDRPSTHLCHLRVHHPSALVLAHGEAHGGGVHEGAAALPVVQLDVLGVVLGLGGAAVDLGGGGLGEGVRDGVGWGKGDGVGWGKGWGGGRGSAQNAGK